MGETGMELTRSQELIRKLKQAKAEKKLSYSAILAELERNNSGMAMSTLKRVFADGSEEKDSFNYEGTLLPIARVLLGDEAEREAELSGLRAMVKKQEEEIVRLREMREHLEARIEFLLAQIEKKDQRMDKLLDKLLGGAESDSKDEVYRMR
jgi:hypothetical protein